MTPDHKKPTAGFWITVALIAVLVYPISFGPACWITSQNLGGLASPGQSDAPPRAMIVYCPLAKLSTSQSVAGRAARWWMVLGIRKGEWAVVITSMRGDVLVCK